MAFGKLQELLPSRPLVYKGQNVVNLTLFAIAIACGVVLVADPSRTALFPVLAVLSLLFGVLLIIPIGGGGMPAGISLLQSSPRLSGPAVGLVPQKPPPILAGGPRRGAGPVLSVIIWRGLKPAVPHVTFR